MELFFHNYPQLILLREFLERFLSETVHNFPPRIPLNLRRKMELRGKLGLGMFFLAYILRVLNLTMVDTKLNF